MEKSELFGIEVKTWSEVDVFKPEPLKFMIYVFHFKNNNSNRKLQRLSTSQCGVNFN